MVTVGGPSRMVDGGLMGDTRSERDGGFGKT